MKELRVCDVSSYRNFVCMDAGTFEELLRVVAPSINYQDTNMRQAISPAERLAVTLRFLLLVSLIRIAKLYYNYYIIASVLSSR